MNARISPLLADRLDPARTAGHALAVARVDEARCIGCTLCRQACPVDAIVGAAQRMHTVLPALCVGCELCIPPCPVDCIALVPAGRAWSPEDARAARRRFDARNQRMRAGTADDAEAAAVRALAAPDPERTFRRQAVAAALARARLRRRAAGRGTPSR